MRSNIEPSGAHLDVEANGRITTRKLIVFGGLEAGVGRSVCAATLAMSLAKRWHCLALDLDARGRNLQTYFGHQAASVGIAEFLEHPGSGLDTVQSRTRVANLDCVGWSSGGAIPVALGSLRINSLLQSLQSHPADYVLATLPAGMSDDALEIFRSADIPILVTLATPARLDRAFEFLQRCASMGFSRNVYLIVNRVQRGGELRDVAAISEKMRESLSFNVSVLGTIQHDHQIEASFRPGMPLSIQHLQSFASRPFDDIAIRLERLLPRSRPNIPTVRQATGRHNGDGNRLSALFGLFGKRARQLEDELRQKDEAARRFQQEHENAITRIGELQRIVDSKDEEIAGVTAEKDAVQREYADLLQQIEAMTRSLAEAEERELGHNEALRLKNQEIQELTNRLLHVTVEQEANASQTAEELGRLSGQLRVSMEDLKSAFSDKNAQMIKHVQDLEGTVGLQRTDIEQFKEQIRELELLRAAADQQSTALRLEIESVRSQRDDTLRRLQEVEAHAQQLNAIVGEKDGATLELTSRFAELSSEFQQSTKQAAGALRQLSEDVQLQRVEIAKRFVDVEQIVRARDALDRKDESIRELTGRLEDLATAHSNSTLRASEVLQQIFGEVQLHRTQITRSLAEVECRVQDRDAALEKKDQVIRTLEERVAALTSEQNSLAARTMEALRRMSAEIGFQREESVAAIESYRSFSSSNEERTRALLVQINDTAREKEQLLREMEATVRRQVSELEDLCRQKEASIHHLEDTIHLIEKENQQLKFDLMSNAENAAMAPGPRVLREQRDVFIGELKLHPPHSITIIAMADSGKEGADFGIEMRSILESAEWKVNFMISSPEKGLFYGVQIVADGSPGATSSARILAGVLGKNRLRFIQTTAPSPNNFDPLRLIIGKSNW
jgi:MinD-like ATPase involved in chromosome partitioning or flagellar assembly